MFPDIFVVIKTRYSPREVWPTSGCECGYRTRCYWGDFQPCLWRPNRDILRGNSGHLLLCLWRQNWVFFFLRKPWDISNHVCGERIQIFFTSSRTNLQQCLWWQNWLFFKETLGHFQLCLWWPNLPEVWPISSCACGHRTGYFSVPSNQVLSVPKPNQSIQDT